jgi:hypothetical protein
MEIEHSPFEGETLAVFFNACQRSQIRALGRGGQKGDVQGCGIVLGIRRRIGGGDTFGQRRRILFCAVKNDVAL